MPHLPWEDILPKTKFPTHPDLDELRKWSRSGSHNARRVASTLLMSALTGDVFEEHRNRFLGALKDYHDVANKHIHVVHESFGYETPVEDHLLPVPDENHPLMHFLDHQVHRALFAEAIHPTHVHNFGKYGWASDSATFWDEESDPVKRLQRDPHMWSFRDRGYNIARNALISPLSTARVASFVAADHSLQIASDHSLPGSAVLSAYSRNLRNDAADFGLMKPKEDFRSAFWDGEEHPCAGNCGFGPFHRGSPPEPPPLIDRIGR